MCTTTDHSEWFDAMPTRLQQDDLWEQEIVPRLPTNLGEQAKRLGALQRRRGIKQASDLLRAILSWILYQRSLRQLGCAGYMGYPFQNNATSELFDSSIF